MRALFQQIPPLLIVGISIFFYGLHNFSRSSGEKGQDIVAVLIVCIFSLIPLLMHRIIKRNIKSKNIFSTLQILLSFIILGLYIVWFGH